ncbi:xylulose-5-phosphate/fructose-6-phosphate phosphoketolase [Filimonas zeae]|uniref:Phosphoketolase n=1 Tax=Filimonas zeae TaxID=1737353 RepID=A0A917IY66_9BACT|nr:phosphoketolase family protein [Filimonas zeae]MDR6338806.1 xylulose-5-phosphate/fructose-6-phosphate phosphoketolase [Filimonas zeae]GGH66509.1 putative phosphoketolase [Filimonas zeae]
MKPLATEELQLLHRYWQAANYLAVGQIYLRDNVLLQQPLQPQHIKPRLLGHWGTSPGLNLIYTHLNRLIRHTGADVLYICGPGHGAPAILAHAYLEGTFTQTYPEVTQNAAGMLRFFRQFSTPGGIPSHVSAHTPGSIHEGGELGYSLAHAFGAAFDNPNLLVACVVGDGEAETGPLEGSWKSIHFLNPARDGAVLPILHLNGYKIAGPTVLARMPDRQVRQLFEGHGYEVLLVEGNDPLLVHERMSEVLGKAYAKIRAIQEQARTGALTQTPRWPMIILRTPKGWTCPKEWEHHPLEGSFRAHQVPLDEVNKNPEQLAMLETWLKSYHPEDLFDANGTLLPELAAMAPEGSKRLGATPYGNGGHLLQELQLPDYRKYALPVKTPATTTGMATQQLGKYLRDVFAANEQQQNFRLFCPDETNSNKLTAVFEATNRCSMNALFLSDDHISKDGRVMEVLSEHLCQGWLEGYLLTGRHGFFPCYEAFITIIDSMFNQHAKWLKTCNELPWRQPIASLNYLLTSHAWRQDHNGYSHQGPGFIDTVVNKKSTVIRLYFPPDANTLLAITHHCLRSKNYVNVIIAGKQPELQYLDMEAAIQHCIKGASEWHWAGNSPSAQPQVILACAGDVPTMETVAAAWLLRKNLPQLQTRVVNVIDLMALTPRPYHSHGLTNEDFEQLFTTDTPVIFAFHGYVRVIHDLIHGRPNPSRFHARGFMEEGSTTTPFDMVVLNQVSRYHLAIEAIKRSVPEDENGKQVIQLFEQKLEEHNLYIREHLVDMPEIAAWKWE